MFFSRASPKKSIYSIEANKQGVATNEIFQTRDYSITIENIPDEGVFEFKIAEEYFFDSIKKENDFNYPDHYQCPSWQLASLSFLEPS